MWHALVPGAGNYTRLEGGLWQERRLVGAWHTRLLTAHRVTISNLSPSHPPFYDMKPLGIYQKILKGVIEFPSFLSLRSKDLIRKLLNPEVKYRLGVSDVISELNILEWIVDKITQVV